MKSLIFGVALLLFAPALVEPALNPEVTQETILETICSPGYTNTVRPTFWASQKLKRDMLEARGETWEQAPLYQLDHIIPLCLGGSPDDESNLQLQPWDEAKRKDRIEAVLLCHVCAGDVSLAEAQREIATDWKEAYRKYATQICRRSRQ